jgi:hypothetical protein
MPEENRFLTLEDFQKDQWEWTQRNFNAVPGWLEALAPIVGAYEEFGELVSARMNENVKEQQDAVADITIYLTDVCNRIGLPLMQLRFSQKMPYPPGNFCMMMIKSLGALSHSVLKQGQNIRMKENHPEQARLHMSACMDHLEFYCVENWHMTLFNDIVFPVWEKVRQRDWNKLRETQGAPAE